MSHFQILSKKNYYLKFPGMPAYQNVPDFPDVMREGADDRSAFDEVSIFDGNYLSQLADPVYLHTLCNTKFSLAPSGNVEETWRLHESLACGAIPVVTDGGTYFSHYMPKSLTSLFITIDHSDLHSRF